MAAIRLGGTAHDLTVLMLQPAQPVHRQPSEYFFDRPRKTVLSILTISISCSAIYGARPSSFPSERRALRRPTCQILGYLEEQGTSACRDAWHWSAEEFRPRTYRCATLQQNFVIIDVSGTSPASSARWIGSPRRCPPEEAIYIHEDGDTSRKLDFSKKRSCAQSTLTTTPT